MSYRGSSHEGLQCQIPPRFKFRVNFYTSPMGFPGRRRHSCPCMTGLTISTLSYMKLTVQFVHPAAPLLMESSHYTGLVLGWDTIDRLRWAILVEKMCLVPATAFFPASDLAGQSLLLTLWRITAFLLTQIRAPSFPSPSTYASHPPLGSFPLLPGRCSRWDPRLSSRITLCPCKDLRHPTCREVLEVVWFPPHTSVPSVLGEPALTQTSTLFARWGLQHDTTEMWCGEDVFQAVTVCILGSVVAGEKGRASITAREMGLKSPGLFTKLEQTEASRYLWVAPG